MTRRTPLHLVKHYPRPISQVSLRETLGLCTCGRKPSGGYRKCSLCIEYTKEHRRKTSGKRNCMVCNLASAHDLCGYCTKRLREGCRQREKEAA